jgi:DNA-binding MarR family transcriptional regulator
MRKDGGTPLTNQVDPRLAILEQAKKVRAELDAEAAAAAGVTFNQAQVIALIDEAGGDAMVSKLAPLLDRAVHTLTSAVSGLERLGLVERIRRRGEDGRIVRIALTGTGRDALSKLRLTGLPLP